jgi:hypothetical protein
MLLLQRGIPIVDFMLQAIILGKIQANGIVDVRTRFVGQTTDFPNVSTRILPLVYLVVLFKRRKRPLFMSFGPNAIVEHRPCRRVISRANLQ